jgi:hypothetical protein
MTVVSASLRMELMEHGFEVSDDDAVIFRNGRNDIFLGEGMNDFDGNGFVLGVVASADVECIWSNSISSSSCSVAVAVSDGGVSGGGGDDADDDDDDPVIEYLFLKLVVFQKEVSNYCCMVIVLTT